jgi:hypothetical protein
MKRLIRDPLFWLAVVMYGVYLDSCRVALGG